jgi:hypothetical protein
MLSTLFDRVWTNTILYALSIALAWSIRKYSSPLISSGLIVGSTVLYLTNFIGHVDQERKIQNLGGHAPVLRTWSPWNIRVLVNAVSYARKHLNHVFWNEVSFFSA